MRQLIFCFVLGSSFILPSVGRAACNIVNGKAYGDCVGVTVQTGIKPAINVRTWVSESAIVASATVFPGGHLDLSGIANGEIVVMRGGKLVISGIANSVRNEGGEVEIEGIVDLLKSDGGSVVVGGQVHSFLGNGPVHFKAGAVFQGTPLDKAKRIGVSK